MKVYINTDIEGIAGWVFYSEYSNSMFNFHHIQRMNRLLTNETNAAVKAAFDAGATDVYVNDNHGHCFSIFFEDLDPRCRIIHGRSGYFDAWLPMLDETFDAAIGIGMHAMAGVEKAVCPHSYWRLKLGNGDNIVLSECTMFAALAGEKGIPLVAISGDDKIAMEVNEKIPNCETAVVKEGLGPQNACSLIPSRACELIAEKVKAGLRNIKNIKPYKLEGPFTLNLADRDPELISTEDGTGDVLWDVMFNVGNIFNHWGEQPIDDRSWRFPRDVFDK
jgi:D-amino peptidase